MCHNMEIRNLIMKVIIHPSILVEPYPRHAIIDACIIVVNILHSICYYVIIIHLSYGLHCHVICQFLASRLSREFSGPGSRHGCHVTFYKCHTVRQARETITL